MGYKTDAADALHGALAGRADEAALVLALEAQAVEELLPNGRVVAIAHDGDHVPAVVTEVLDRPAARHVPLVRHECKEDQDQEPENPGDDETCECARVLEGDERQNLRHAQTSLRVVLNLGGQWWQSS